MVSKLLIRLMLWIVVWRDNSSHSRGLITIRILSCPTLQPSGGNLTGAWNNNLEFDGYQEIMRRDNYTFFILFWPADGKYKYSILACWQVWKQINTIVLEKDNPLWPVAFLNDSDIACWLDIYKSRRFYRLNENEVLLQLKIFVN